VEEPSAYESRRGSLSAFVRELFRGEVDVLVHHSHGGRTRWKRILVPVRGASDVAHSMLDSFEGNVETRISRTRVERFLVRHAREYDPVILGASQDRSAASRFVSPPTFERIDGDELDTDIAIVDRH
jgi:hypothetical protein